MVDECAFPKEPSDHRRIRLRLASEYRDVDPQNDMHDIRKIISAKHDLSWQYEEEEMAKRGEYNWFQIREAIKHDNAYQINERAKTIENVFSTVEDDPIKKDFEYWRRRQREIALQKGIPEHIRPYEVPKMRLHKRIKQPDFSKLKFKSQAEIERLKNSEEAQRLRAYDTKK